MNSRYECTQLSLDKLVLWVNKDLPMNAMCYDNILSVFKLTDRELGSELKPWFMVTAASQKAQI